MDTFWGTFNIVLGGICFGAGIIAFYRQQEKQTAALRGCEMFLGQISAHLSHIYQHGITTHRGLDGD